MGFPGAHVIIQSPQGVLLAQGARVKLKHKLRLPKGYWQMVWRLGRGVPAAAGFLLPAQHVLPCLLGAKLPLVVVNPSMRFSQLTRDQHTPFPPRPQGLEKVGPMIQVRPKTSLKFAFSEKTFSQVTKLAHHLERISLPGGDRSLPSHSIWALDPALPGAKISLISLPRANQVPFLHKLPRV